MRLLRLLGIGGKKETVKPQICGENPKTKNESWLTIGEIEHIKTLKDPETIDNYTKLAEQRKKIYQTLQIIELDIDIENILNKLSFIGPTYKTRVEKQNPIDLKGLLLNASINLELDRLVTLILHEELKKYPRFSVTVRSDQNCLPSNSKAVSYYSEKQKDRVTLDQSPISNVIEDILSVKAQIEAATKRAFSAAKLSACKEDKQ